MDQDLKTQQNDENVPDEAEGVDRRGFLLGLRKWSLAVIGGALLGGALLGSDREAHAGAWANRGGGGGGGAWANRAGGGGAVVVAPGGGGGAWANHAGGGGAWANRGAAWINGGGAWVNRF
jgi:hypothetical protein